MDSFFAASMNPQVLTRITSAPAEILDDRRAVSHEVTDEPFRIDGGLVAAKRDDAEFHTDVGWRAARREVIMEGN